MAKDIPPGFEYAMMPTPSLSASDKLSWNVAQADSCAVLLPRGRSPRFRPRRIGPSGGKPGLRSVPGAVRPQRRLRWVISKPRIVLQMINVKEFARRLSTLGAETFTSDDVVDLATAADVRISPELEIDATLAQRLLDRISPEVPVTGAQIAASEWPPPVSTRPAAPPMVFSNPGAVDAPADQSARSRGSAPGRTGRRPDSRRTGR
jgi:hypothetical protein